MSLPLFSGSSCPDRSPVSSRSRAEGEHYRARRQSSVTVHKRMETRSGSKEMGFLFDSITGRIARPHERVTGRRLTRPSRSYFLSRKSVPRAESGARRDWQVFHERETERERERERGGGREKEKQEALARYILRLYIFETNLFLSVLTLLSIFSILSRLFNRVRPGCRVFFSGQAHLLGGGGGRITLPSGNIFPYRYLSLCLSRIRPFLCIG